MKILMIFFIFLSLSFSAPQVSTVSMDIMREVQKQYQSEKSQMYIKAYLTDKNLSADEINNIKDRLNLFFSSNTFLETGGAYLTALFPENDLRQLLNDFKRGNFFDNQGRLKSSGNSNISQKIQQLFNKLDPYLYRYLEHNIIPEPKLQEN